MFSETATVDLIRQITCLILKGSNVLYIISLKQTGKSMR